MEAHQIDDLFNRWTKILAMTPDKLKDRSESLLALLGDFRYAGRFVPPGRKRDRLETFASNIARAITDLTGASEPLATIDEYLKGAQFRKEIDGMPPHSNLFLGRREELQLLTDALENTECRFIQVIGIGGQGKTQLVNHWLAFLENAHRADIEAIYCHTFYTFPSHSFKKVPEFIEESHRFFFPELSVKSPPEQWPREIAWAVGASKDDLEKLPDCFPNDIKTRLFEIIDKNSKRIIILDGLEACLNHPANTLKKDAADIKILLEELLTLTSGFCIITSRFPLKLFERKNERIKRNIYLKGLSSKDGAAFLKQLGIGFTEPELELLSIQLGGHPLSLLTYGDILADQAHGSPHWLPRAEFEAPYQRIEKIPEDLNAPFWDRADDEAWEVGAAEDKAKERVMGLLRSYLRYFERLEHPYGQVSIQFIQLLAFFQDSALLEDIQVLIGLSDVPVINNHLQNRLLHEREIDQERLLELVDDLERRQLILRSEISSSPSQQAEDSSETVLPFYIQTHVILQDFFRQQLERHDTFKDAWKKGHNALANYYLTIKSENEIQPDTKHDLLMHYRAVEHACQAENWNLAYDVYWRRIHRNSENIGEDQYQWHAWEHHGLLSPDIRTLSWFYKAPAKEKDTGSLWRSYEDTFQDQPPQQKVHIRTATGLCLLNLGYIDEAGSPLNDAYRSAENSDDFLTASILGGLMGDRFLIQGKFKKADEWIEKALRASAKSGDSSQLRSKRAKVANLLACQGEWNRANAEFDVMLDFHKEWLGLPQDSPSYEYPGTRSGYYYSDFLLNCAIIVLEERLSPAELGYVGVDKEDERAWAVRILEYVRNGTDQVLNETPNLNEHDRALNELIHAQALAEYEIYKQDRDEINVDDLEKTLDTIETARQRQEEIGRRQDMPLTLVRKGFILNYLGRYDEALDSINEALRISWEGEMRLYECEANLVRCRIYHDKASKVEKDQERRNLLNYAAESYWEAAFLVKQLGYWKRIFNLRSLRNDLITAGFSEKRLKDVSKQ